MPPSRTISAGSSSSSAPKRSLPFKPPGPAKKANNSATTSGADSRGAAKAKEPVRKTKVTAKQPVTTVLSSSPPSAEDEDLLGSDIDLDDADDLPAMRNGQTALDHQVIDEDDEVLSIPGDASEKDDTIEGIPGPLITRLLHESFEDKQLKIGKQANMLVKKYVDIFIQEALARAALEKKRSAQSKSGSADQVRNALAALDEEWLDTDDLEKVAAALVMDF